MRNGNEAIVTDPVVIEYKDGMTGEAAKWRGWQGRCAKDGCGTKFSWGEDGRYSPISEHELDLVELSP